MEAIKALGSWDEIMDTLQKRLAEQEKRHQGGNKWIGTGGTSPFGNSGYNPEGVRIGGESVHKRAVKVWDQREFRNLDNTRELGTRNIKIALRRLRRFAREGAADELDIDGTIAGTARQGYLDIVMRAERRNAVKLLLVPGCRRIDGPVRQAVRGTVLRGDDRVQEPGILLLPQLPVRGRVEGQ